MSLMENSNELSDEQFWKKKIKEHWKPFVVMIAAGVCAVIGAILVFFWFIQSTPIGNYGQATFNDWNLDWVVGFIILIILWELLFVGAPSALVFGLGGYLWWRRLPEETKEEFRSRDKKTKTRAKGAGGGGGFGIVMLIAYCLYHGIMGTYYTSFGTFSYLFWIYTYFLTIIWMIIVLGGFAAIILLIVYFAVWRKKTE
jgi:hypothetical protein